jgi:adenylyl- and sulfurtransferase ThiI
MRAMPVFFAADRVRKEENITRRPKIGTFETSILPYEDCCKPFYYAAPSAHKAKLEAARKAQRSLTSTGLSPMP